MLICFTRLTSTARLPVYATEGSACVDFFPPTDWPGADVEYALRNPDSREQRKLIVPTGIAVQVPPGYGLLVFSRSGHGFKHDVRLANCVGVIDSDYRGEIKVALTKDTREPWPESIFEGKAIAQVLVISAPHFTWCEVDELDPTARGDQGFGSTDQGG